MKNPSIEQLKIIIGKNIYKFRKEKNISQTELCFQAEIDVSTLSRIERGKLNATIETYHKICLILDIELNEIFKG